MLFNVKAESPDDLEDWPKVREAILRYVRIRTGRSDVAEDIAQETLLRLIVLCESQAIGSLFALGFRIADNLMIDNYRRETRQSSDMNEDWECDAPSLDRVLDSKRAVEVLSLCLRRMPPLRRDVIIRRRLKQESCRAIGDELSMSAKAVEKHISRGLVDLRQAFNRAGIEPVGE